MVSAIRCLRQKLIEVRSGSTAEVGLGVDDVRLAPRKGSRETPVALPVWCYVWTLLEIGTAHKQANEPADVICTALHRTH